MNAFQAAHIAQPPPGQHRPSRVRSIHRHIRSPRWAHVQPQNSRSGCLIEGARTADKLRRRAVQASQDWRCPNKETCAVPSVKRPWNEKDCCAWRIGFLRQKRAIAPARMPGSRSEGRAGNGSTARCSRSRQGGGTMPKSDQLPGFGGARRLRRCGGKTRQRRGITWSAAKHEQQGVVAKAWHEGRPRDRRSRVAPIGPAGLPADPHRSAAFCSADDEAVILLQISNGRPDGEALRAAAVLLQPGSSAQAARARLAWDRRRVKRPKRRSRCRHQRMQPAPQGRQLAHVGNYRIAPRLMNQKIVRKCSCLLVSRAMWRVISSQTSPTLNPRHERQHKRDSRRDGAWRRFRRRLARSIRGSIAPESWLARGLPRGLSGAISFNFQKKSLPAVDQVRPTFRSRALRREPHGQSLDSRAVEFTSRHERA